MVNNSFINIFCCILLNTILERKKKSKKLSNGIVSHDIFETFRVLLIIIVIVFESCK